VKVLRKSWFKRTAFVGFGKQKLWGRAQKNVTF